MAGVSDVLGVFGSGIGVLLMVDILINYYNQLVREQVEVVMPRLGALLGENKKNHNGWNPWCRKTTIH